MREIFLTKARPLAKYLIAGTVLMVVNLWAADKLELLAGLLAGYGLGMASRHLTRCGTSDDTL